MGDRIHVRILNWDKYNSGKRSDVKNPTWFSVDIAFATSESLFELDAEETIVWLCLVALARKKSSEEINVALGWFLQFCGNKVTGPAVYSTLQKLDKACLEWVSGHVTDASRTRNVDVTSTARARNANTPLHYTTEQNTTEHYTTGQDSEPHAVPSAVDPDLVDDEIEDAPEPDVMELWNSYCGSMPTVISVSPKRLKRWKNRWRENPNREFWVNAIAKMAENPFFRGENDRGWKGTLDWLLKDDNVTRVLEGAYDRGPGSPRKTFSQMVSDQNQALVEELRLAGKIT